MNGRLHIILAWIIASLPVIAPAQSSKDLGLPFYYDHFTPHDYRAHPQNWAIAQDERGVIFVANYAGILTYDGSEWNVIRTPPNSTVRSLDADGAGHVYVGLKGDFGYVSADSIGQLEYRSLVGKLPQEHLGFRDIWGTHVVGSDVYFQSHASLIRWNGSDFKVWSSDAGFHTSFEVAGELYVREKGVGLLRVIDESLVLVPGGDVLAQSELFLLEEHPQGGLLAATQKHGLFRFTSSGSQRIRTEADEWMRKHRLYSGTSLGNGIYALGFFDGGGLVVIDSNGKWIDSFTADSGLPDGWINCVFSDRQGGVWLALNNKGIVRLDAPAGLTRFDDRNGLEGTISTIRRSGDDMYVGTTSGLFRFVRARSIGERAGFERIPWISSPTTSVVPIADGLLVATHAGVRFSNSNSEIEEVAEGRYFSLLPSEHDSSVVFLGSESGVSLLRRTGRKWELLDDVALLGEEVSSMIETSPGEIVLTTRSNMAYSLKFSSDWSVAGRQKIDMSSADFKGRAFVTKIGGGVFVATKKGFLTLTRRSGKWAVNHLSGFYSINAESDTLLAFTSTASGDVWRLYSDRVVVSRRHGDTYVVSTPALVDQVRWSAPANILVDPSGIAWISSASTLVRYDSNLDNLKSYGAPYPPVVRRITTIDENRLLFGGALVDEQGRFTTTQESSRIPRLAFEQNALRFDFALPSFNHAGQNEFQYRLDGKDRDWSEWTKESSKNFTNLYEGTYKFRVRGRNAQGFISPESIFTFSISPPWYRTEWAFLSYLLGFVGVVLFGARHLRMVKENKKAKAQAKELAKEREVNERLNDLNRRLQQANESLLQADRLKDEFLANTSHELRTPLTGILGCAAILREEVTEEQTEFIDMIDENGQRLLHTLDSLLDLARLRAGLMDLQNKDIDVGEKAFAVARSYLPELEKKAVELDVHIDGDLTAWLDEHCLECVLNHLIGNAVKFTDVGRIDVSIRRDAANVVVSVADTGIGIDEEFLPFLFDEFKQESTGLTRSHEGNGLGLAVTARLVDLMGGEIEVESQKGVGSTFTATLPLRNNAESGDGMASRMPDIGKLSLSSDGAAA